MDRSLKHVRGIHADPAKRIMDELEEAVPAEIKGKIDWTHSKENQGPWSRKTIVNMWFVHGIDTSAMIETLKKRKNNSGGQVLQDQRRSSESKSGIESPKKPRRKHKHRSSRP